MLPKSAPDAVAARGVKRIETVRNWDRAGVRGAMGSPAIGVLCHHTAAAWKNKRGEILLSPSLGLLKNGRSGSSPLSPPVCQVHLSRDEVVTFVAAGLANHAGKGSSVVIEQLKRGEQIVGIARDRKLRDDIGGNRFFVGIEAEHNGLDEPWTESFMEVYARLAVGLADSLSLTWKAITGHKHFTARKTDPSFNWALFTEILKSVSGDVDEVLTPKPPTGPSRPFEPYSPAEWAKVTGDNVLSIGDRGEPVRRLQVLLNLSGDRLVADGVFGAQTAVAVADFQKARGAKAGPSLGTVGLFTARKMGLAQGI
jgi:hypothetical protein